jgi:transposase
MRDIVCGSPAVALPVAEVPMIEPDSVRQLRDLHRQGWGTKRIARELGLARNTVKRYLRLGAAAEKQERPAARCLDAEGVALAIKLFETEAQGNAVVVTELLRARGYDVGLRTVQQTVQHRRRELRAQQLATVRYETSPGAQMQIDFGQKLVWIAGELVRVFLLVAVLSYSRRLFVKAFLAERQDDWREGIAAAFRHFGGVPRTLLGDNARALVLAHDRATQTVTFHPGYVAFCRDWGVIPRACAPYRARTKGKTESGVKYVKRNALAGRRFDSFAALESHLVEWMRRADERIHGTTKETPMERFLRDEKQALQPLPMRAFAARERELVRRVANDSFVEVDTVRYSVPHALVRDRVKVRVGVDQVRIFHGTTLVATHRRSFEPYSVVSDPAHFAGLLRPPGAPVEDTVSRLADFGRSLAEYAAVVETRGVA